MGPASWRRSNACGSASASGSPARGSSACRAICSTPPTNRWRARRTCAAPTCPCASPPGHSLRSSCLSRYLDYCSELLSLTSKVAALYVQDSQDPVLLDAVNDVETLTTGLSRKIWQKIMIIDTLEPSRRLT